MRKDIIAITALYLIKIFGSTVTPVTLEFKRLKYVQQASITSRVSVATFARGNTGRLCWLHARLCRAFLVYIYNTESKYIFQN